MSFEPRKFVFDYREIPLHRHEIEKFMGYEAGSSPEPIPEMIEEAMEKAVFHCDIQGGYSVFSEIDKDKKKYLFRIENQVFDIKRIISNQLRKSEKAALFVCTAGKGMGEWSKKLMREGDLMMGYVVDVIGSEVVEKAMDLIHDRLAHEMAQEGYGVTDRYSPGYCDWQVIEQQKLFSFFPKGFCNITLSASSLMDPIKSVSGIIGIGTDLKRKGYPCDFCSLKNCIYRHNNPGSIVKTS